MWIPDRFCLGLSVGMQENQGSMKYGDDALTKEDSWQIHRP
jgi:hypothetical protein